jgi:hypothetical protein
MYFKSYSQGLSNGKLHQVQSSDLRLQTPPILQTPGYEPLLEESQEYDWNSTFQYRENAVFSQYYGGWEMLSIVDRGGAIRWALNRAYYVAHHLSMSPGDPTPTQQ